MKRAGARAPLAFALLATLLVAAGAAPVALADEHAREDVAATGHGPAAGEQGEHAGAGHAGGEHEAHIDGKTLALQILNFAVLVGLIVFFGRKAVSRALLQRHEQLKTELAAAAEARRAAESRLAVQETRLGSLEQEIEAMRTAIKHEAEVEKARLIAAAEERARRIREETKFVLEQQLKEAEIQLRREVVEAAVKVAEQIVRRSLGGGDQQRLLDTFVSEVASGDGQPPLGGPHTDGAPPAPRPHPRSQV